jgi:hypothetical protein
MATKRHKRHKIVLYFLCLFVALSFAPHTSRAQLRYVATPFRHGEALTYKVRYGFIRLGTLRLRQSIADPLTTDTMRVEIEGSSAAGLPFISVHFVTRAMLDVFRPTNIRFELVTGSAGTDRSVYWTDAAAGRSFAVSFSDGEVDRSDTLDVERPFYDGSGLLMFVRAVAGSDTSLALPTIMDHALGTTSITFSSAIEDISVPAYERPIRAHPYHGSTDWVGSSFGGFSGAFRGWVSTDDARRILKADVKLFIGSATIELEEVGH